MTVASEIRLQARHLVHFNWAHGANYGSSGDRNKIAVFIAARRAITVVISKFGNAYKYRYVDPTNVRYPHGLLEMHLEINVFFWKCKRRPVYWITVRLLHDAYIYCAY